MSEPVDLREASQTPWVVYIVRTNSGKLYTGITTNLDRRLAEHLDKDGKNRGAKFFRLDPLSTLVYRETCRNRSDASKRERQIKSLSRLQKLQLIS